MAKVRTLILHAPGTNCDAETAFAFELAGSVVESAQISELVLEEKLLPSFQIMVIPGGFTYGDDISAGKILANELRLKLDEDIRRFVDDGKLILGICNGFQVLLKAGILPGCGDANPGSLTLATNDSGRFECRWVHLRINETTPCVFTRGIGNMYLPVAHGEGKVFAATGVPESLNAVLYYADEKGGISAGYPHNPNGSLGNIAGICDASGRIFALMPHPERFVRWTQHPRWGRETPRNCGDGLQIFVNAVEWAKTI
ncbi:MAG: phosphoribosylformylglycinamidine synthase I [Dehalococcoidia bacterium]|nr:MAG: phosphoribosylformylglycinamidine synthase I [Dehalococcoidia bacterium]